MELEQSQLEYLANRGKNYDKKYYMFEKLLNKIDNVNSVIELFGGIGIESTYIENKFNNICKHIIIEKDNKCFECLQKRFWNNKHIDIYNVDCFDFVYNDMVDLLVVDSTFNKKVSNKVLKLITNFKAKQIIITETGVFGVKFNKNLTYEQYWNNVKYNLSKIGLFLTDVEYYTDFGLMLIKTSNNNKPLNLHYVTKECQSLLWRDIRDGII